MKQNITLSIDEALLKKGKILAAEKDTSVSKMLSELLKDQVEKKDQYEAAKKDAIRTLKSGFHMGDRVTWR